MGRGKKEDRKKGEEKKTKRRGGKKEAISDGSRPGGKVVGRKESGIAWERSSMREVRVHYMKF
jgi:hypothetical protein